MSLDALVLGSGHNGLTCACYLAQQGRRVLVLEANATVGGLTVTQEITRPGFHSDLHAFGYQFASLSPAPEELGLKLDLLRPDVAFAHAFPDGRTMQMHAALDDTCARIASFSSRDASQWRALYARWLEAKPAIAAALNASPAPLGWPSPDAFRFAMQSLRSWSTEWFEQEAVRMFLGTFSLHANVAPDQAGGGQIAWMFDSIIQEFGNRVVRGGMGNLALTLARRLEELGGSVRTGARVSKILVSNGRAVGVRLESGEEIEAGLIASNVDPRTLTLDLLGPEVVGAAIADKMGRYEWGDSIMVIYLALDEPPRFRAGQDASRACYVHCTPPSLEYVSRMFTQTRGGELPDGPVLIVCNDGVADPSRMPAGKGLVKILVKCVPYSLDWDAVKEAYADRVIALLQEHYIENLSVLSRVVHSPLDQERHISSAVRGTELQGAFVPYQSGPMRPIPELAQYRTPVPNVYLCCSGSHPGPGVSFMPGRNAARVIATDCS